MSSIQTLLKNKPPRGMVAVQVAISMTALLGVGGLALDGGVLFAERRHAQATADAAALAAAADLYYNYRSNAGADTGGTAKTSALTTASANGYTNDNLNSVVTVNIPPKAGNFIKQAGYAEVIVQYNQQRGLSNIFGSGTIPVTARAVARGAWVASTPGILLLDPTGSGALSVTGNGGVTETGAAVVVNSNSASAAVDKGNGSATATAFAITGSPGIKDSGNGSLTTSPTANNVTTGVSPTPDPLRYLPAPDPASLTSGASPKIKKQAFIL